MLLVRVGRGAAAARAGRPRRGRRCGGAAGRRRAVALRLDLRPVAVRGERRLLERLAENLRRERRPLQRAGRLRRGRHGARDGGSALLRVVNSGPAVDPARAATAARAVRARRARARRSRRRARAVDRPLGGRGARRPGRARAAARGRARGRRHAAAGLAAAPVAALLPGAIVAVDGERRLRLRLHARRARGRGPSPDSPSTPATVRLQPGRERGEEGGAAEQEGAHAHSQAARPQAPLKSAAGTSAARGRRRAAAAIAPPANAPVISRCSCFIATCEPSRS